MKRILAALLCASILSACAQSKTIEGRTYAPYGILNKDEERVDCIAYQASIGNIIWAVLLFGTVAMPVYVFGFATFEPVGNKTPRGCASEGPRVFENGK